MADDLATKYGFADADDGEDSLASKYGFAPRTMGQRFSDSYIDSASRAEIGGGVTFARQYYKKKGYTEKQINVAIRRIQEDAARKNEADPAIKGKGFDKLAPANIGRLAVDFAGGMLGGIDPTYVISAGKNAVTRVLTQAGVNASESAASQTVQKKKGIRDDFSWGEVGMNAAAGAGFQGAQEAGRVVKNVMTPKSLDSAAKFGDSFGTVTSTIRTPARNKAVGGVKNSYHLRGQAVDIARGKGVTHKKIETAYRRAGYDIVESLDEGDHSHFAFRFKGGKKPAPDNDASKPTLHDLVEMGQNREEFVDPAEATYAKWDNAEKDITDSIQQRLEARDNEDLLRAADDSEPVEFKQKSIQDLTDDYENHLSQVDDEMMISPDDRAFLRLDREGREAFIREKEYDRAHQEWVDKNFDEGTVVKGYGHNIDEHGNYLDEQRLRAVEDEDSELARARLAKDEAEADKMESDQAKQTEDNYWQTRNILDAVVKGLPHKLTKKTVADAIDRIENTIFYAKDMDRNDLIPTLEDTKEVWRQIALNLGMGREHNSADKFFEPRYQGRQRPMEANDSMSSADAALNDHYAKNAGKYEKQMELWDKWSDENPEPQGVSHRTNVWKAWKAKYDEMVDIMSRLWDDDSGELRGDDDSPIPRDPLIAGVHQDVNDVLRARQVSREDYDLRKPYPRHDPVPEKTPDSPRTLGQTLKDLWNDESGELRGDDEGPIGEESPAIQKLRKAIKDAIPIRREQNKRQSEVRSDRLREVSRAFQYSEGEQAHGVALEHLKGAYPKADYESIRENFTQKELDEIFNLVRTHPRLHEFDKINGMNGLAKMFDKDIGEVPTRSELEVLERVLPKDILDTLLTNRQFREKMQEWVAEGLNLPRSLMASFDLSAPFRQGVFLIHRKEFWKAFGTMFKLAFSEKAWGDFQDSIAARPTHKLMRQAGLAITKKGGDLSQREEAFMSSWAERIPGIGRIVKGSNRGYTGFLNKLRADVFDDFVRKYADAGISLENNHKALRDIARFVNNATGRGDLGPKLNAAAPALAGAFFSPRLMASRVNMLNPMFYVRLDPIVRKEAIKSAIVFGGIVTSVLGLSALAGADVETDMRSSDFGKMKIGNTRFDMTGGFASYLRLGAQLATGTTKTQKGDVKDYGKDVMTGTRADAIERFFRSKESPLASLFHDMMAGKDLRHPKNVIGEESTIPEAVMKRFIPMISQDVYDVWKEYGALAAAGAVVPSAFGISSQTYKPKGQSLEEKTGFGEKSNSNNNSKEDDLAKKYGF